ncbi:MAG: hypothetical protein TECD_00584 [Hyphomicrobiaceae bacterium hypho_1]
MNAFENHNNETQKETKKSLIMECKVCRTQYDPEVGDSLHHINPGTPFAQLPASWSCPTCSAPASDFFVLMDPKALKDQEKILREAPERLVEDFTEIWHSKMAGIIIVNKKLYVQSIGFRMYKGRPLGVLITPWFMNLVQLPGVDDNWSNLTAGVKEVIEFPSGCYEFIHNRRDNTGGYKACSLFSQMFFFKMQKQAITVAYAIMQVLFSNNFQDETYPDINNNSSFEKKLSTVQQTKSNSEPSRRKIITAGII